MSSISRAPAFLLLANDPALDFLNTTPMVDGAPSERIVDYGALVAFLSEAKLISEDDATFARKTWPTGASTVARARSLRELLRKIIIQITRGSAVSPQLVTKLNAELRDDGGDYVELRATADGFEQRRSLRRTSAGDVITPLLRAIASLLVEADLTLVRKCEAPDCALYFLDTSKNRRRRWCSMESCGNRHKVGAYRARGGRTR